VCGCVFGGNDPRSEKGLDEKEDKEKSGVRNNTGGEGHESTSPEGWSNLLNYGGRKGEEDSQRQGGG